LTEIAYAINLRIRQAGSRELGERTARPVRLEVPVSAPAPDLHLRRFEDLPAFLTIDEAASILRVARSTAYEMAAAGSLPTVQFGGRSLRVPRGALARLAGEQLVSAPAAQAADQREPAGGGTDRPTREES
jgi:excisionase family DNA binding protein